MLLLLIYYRILEGLQIFRWPYLLAERTSYLLEKTEQNC